MGDSSGEALIAFSWSISSLPVTILFQVVKHPRLDLQERDMGHKQPSPASP